MLLIMLWQGMYATDLAGRQKVLAGLDAAVTSTQERSMVIEMTARSTERIVRTLLPDNLGRLRMTLTSAVAVFEQSQELNHLGIILTDGGVYGNLERDAKGHIHLWLYPGEKTAYPGQPPPRTRRLLLTETGFVQQASYPGTGEYDHVRRLRQGAQTLSAEGAWRLRVHPWLTTASAVPDVLDPAAIAWGISYTKALYDDKGALLGVLDAQFDAVGLQTYMQDLQSRHDVQLAYIDLGQHDEPRWLAGSAQAPQTLPAALQQVVADRVASREASHHPETFVDIVTLEGERRWLAARSLALKGDVSWWVVVSRPAPWLDPMLGGLLYQALAMVLVIVLGLTLIARRMARRFGRPLADLAARVALMGKGRGRYISKRPLASLTRFRETQVLAHALDSAHALIAQEAAQIEQEQARLRDLNAELEHMATHDDLTDLPNRMLIQQRISQAIEEAKKTGHQLAVLYLDLDRFRTVNDRYGHLFGNRTLKAVGSVIMRAIRPQDTVAHLTGDRFVVLLTDLQSRDDALRMTRQILERLKRPVVVDGLNIQMGASIGVSLYPEHGQTLDALISGADIAMYQAKNLGRNTYHFYSPAMGEAAQARMEMETSLRDALAESQLRLVYQPQVSMVDGCLSGCEALLRWSHPVLGEVSPARFIPIAEESGLILPIGDWVLKTACQQTKTWVDAGLNPPRVAVNLSARQFLQQNVVQWVAETLRHTGLPAQYLELELTESLLPQDMTQAIAILSQLQALGVALALDDFGTGYSNMGYLTQLQIQTLKIDQSFVRHAPISPKDASVVRAIIALAHNLGFRTLAEGVETAEHWQFLRELGCDEIQGYYISRPLEAEDYAALLRKGARLV